eukprot:m.76587 g.76587  ORF g.76587 m.76587 type:complete len:327 (-) comp12490_c1_seq1:2004-2984(-)
MASRKPKAKKGVFKTYLHTPFETCLQSPDADKREACMVALEAAIGDSFQLLRRAQRFTLSKAYKQKQQQKRKQVTTRVPQNTAAAKVDPDTTLKDAAGETPAKKAHKQDVLPSPSSFPAPDEPTLTAEQTTELKEQRDALLSCMVTGINEVTKVLEKRLKQQQGQKREIAETKSPAAAATAQGDSAQQQSPKHLPPKHVGHNPNSVLILCQSAPALLTQHLPALCYKTQTPLFYAPNLQKRLGRMLATKRVSALLLTTASTAQDDTREPLPQLSSQRQQLSSVLEKFIKATPPLVMPWLDDPARASPDALFHQLHTANSVFSTPNA